MTDDSLKFIDLFCGIGGFHQALSNLGATCVFACDIDKHCRETYQTNYGIMPESDITKIDIAKIPPFDVLCGGFPCQPFSKAGAQKGFKDVRGNLFFNICDIVRHHMPKYIILENVRNLATHDDGNTWRTIYAKIDELGYNTYDSPLIINALHFNVPQNRERVIILCARKDLDFAPPPIVPKNPKTTLTCDLADIMTDETNILSEKLKCVEQVWDEFLHLLIDQLIEIPKFPIWTDWWDNLVGFDIKFYINDHSQAQLDVGHVITSPARPVGAAAIYKKYKGWIDSNRAFYEMHKTLLEPWLLSSRQKPHWTGAMRKMEWQAGDIFGINGEINYLYMDKVLWSTRSSGIRIKQCNYVPTLVAMTSMIPVYGPKHRKLNARELLRLQSFPDTFAYNEQHIYKQVGNSVNVTMIEKCARFLILGEALF